MKPWLVAVLLLVVGCSDPVRDTRREALGPEDPEIPVGPLHRAGQPCLLCHDGSASSSVFSFAGTVYEQSEAEEPAARTEVVVIDYVGRQARATTNEVGNFWIEEADFEPKWPVWVKIERRDEKVTMTSPVYREGSCGACHRGDGDPSHVRRVHWEGEP